MIRPYSHYVDIIGHRSQRDAAFQDVHSEVVIARNVPCSIETVTGSEVRRGQQMQAETTVLVNMQHPQTSFSVDAKCLLREMYGQKVHREINILAAYDPDGRNRVLQIQGRENG